MDNPEFNCHKCKEMYQGERGVQRRAMKGCEKPVPHTVFVLPDDFDEIEFKRCPGNTFRPEVLDYFEMYLSYEQGVLPYPGNFSEQPGKIFDVFSTIRLHRQDKLERDKAEARLQAKLNRRGKTKRT